jgi:uncharacterized protein with PIN domain
MGLDVEHETDESVQSLLRRCIEEGRILLSSSATLLKRKEFERALLVPKGPMIKRLSLVVRRLDLLSSLAPFTRCLVCNLALAHAKDEDIKKKAPPRAAEKKGPFMSCPGCERLYWEGDHVKAMRRIISAVLEGC